MADKFSTLIKYKYLDYIKNAKLSDADSWLIMSALIEYDIKGISPKFENPVLLGLFAAIKYDLDENKGKWEEVVKNKSEAGKKGAERRWGENKQDIAEIAGAIPAKENKKNMADMAKIADLDLDSDLSIDTALNLSEQPEPTEPQEIPTAKAVDQKEVIPIIQNPEQNKIAPVSRSPLETKKKRGIQLTDDQKPLFHAAKACFEADEKTKALMYQDRGSTQMYMENLKLFVVRCHNIAPGITADFMRNVLEHFRVMCGGKLKGRVEFTPSALITRWIWETVIGSLPKAEDELDEKIRKSIKGMFK